MSGGVKLKAAKGAKAKCDRLFSTSGDETAHVCALSSGDTYRCPGAVGAARGVAHEGVSSMDDSDRSPRRGYTPVRCAGTNVKVDASGGRYPCPECGRSISVSRGGLLHLHARPEDRPRVSEIRQLKPGEAVPAGTPRRYPNSGGYVRLRWKVGVRQYVEAYEHRVFDGCVTEAPQVHHKNHDRADNRLENLSPVTPTEHGAEHRDYDHAEIVRLYVEERLTMPQIMERMGLDHGNISRVLKRNGVKARRTWDYSPIARHEQEVRAQIMARRPDVVIAREFGVGSGTVRRIREEMGIPALPPGRPRAVKP